jgi:hypothetical protein
MDKDYIYTVNFAQYITYPCFIRVNLWLKLCCIEIY